MIFLRHILLYTDPLAAADRRAASFSPHGCTRDAECETWKASRHGVEVIGDRSQATATASLDGALMNMKMIQTHTNQYQQPQHPPQPDLLYSVPLSSSRALPHFKPKTEVEVPFVLAVEAGGTTTRAGRAIFEGQKEMASPEAGLRCPTASLAVVESNTPLLPVSGFDFELSRSRSEGKKAQEGRARPFQLELELDQDQDCDRDRAGESEERGATLVCGSRVLGTTVAGTKTDDDATCATTTTTTESMTDTNVTNMNIKTIIETQMEGERMNETRAEAAPLPPHMSTTPSLPTTTSTATTTTTTKTKTALLACDQHRRSQSHARVESMPVDAFAFGADSGRGCGGGVTVDASAGLSPDDAQAQDCRASSEPLKPLPSHVVPLQLGHQDLHQRQQQSIQRPRVLVKRSRSHTHTIGMNTKTNNRSVATAAAPGRSRKLSWTLRIVGGKVGSPTTASHASGTSSSMSTSGDAWGSSSSSSSSSSTSTSTSSTSTSSTPASSATSSPSSSASSPISAVQNACLASPFASDCLSSASSPGLSFAVPSSACPPAKPQSYFVDLLDVQRRCVPFLSSFLSLFSFPPLLLFSSLFPKPILVLNITCICFVAFFLLASSILWKGSTNR